MEKKHPNIGGLFDDLLQEQGILKECTDAAQERVDNFIENAMDAAGKKVETCVGVRDGAICGRETEYTFDTPIHLRMHYVEGAGQLCEKCWYDIHG